jgi:septum formation inhibitor-activating ATPase MinD
MIPMMTTGSGIAVPSVTAAMAATRLAQMPNRMVVVHSVAGVRVKDVFMTV